MHSELKAFCESTGDTIGSRLNDLIDFRNAAAHGADDIEEVLGTSAFQQLAEFTSLLCGAVHEFVLLRYFEALDACGRLELVGEVTEYFPAPDAYILTMKTTRLSVGDLVIVRGTQTCFEASLVELQDHDTSLSLVLAVEGQELGARFSRPAKKGLKVFRELPSKSPHGKQV